MSENVLNHVEDGFEDEGYQEDCYFEYANKSETPSLDDPDEYTLSSLLSSANWSASIYPLIEDEESTENGESCTIETEFIPATKNLKNRLKSHLAEKGFKGLMNLSANRKDVRVKFQDLSKPYIARVTNPKNYHQFLQLVKEGEDQLPDMIPSPDAGINEFHALSVEEQERQKQEWAQELAKVEEEIQTLRHVLASKVRASHELKRKLGFSVWRELQDDMTRGIRNVKESNVYQNVEEKIEQIGKAVTDAPLYQKTESVVKTTAEKTSSLIGGVGSGITNKLGQLKNSESFRSFEEKVGSVYENVKSFTTRSNSLVSIDEAVKEAEAQRSKSASHTPATTPMIPE